MRISGSFFTVSSSPNKSSQIGGGLGDLGAEQEGEEDLKNELIFACIFFFASLVEETDLLRFVVLWRQEEVLH